MWIFKIGEPSSFKSWVCNLSDKRQCRTIYTYLLMCSVTMGVLHVMHAMRCWVWKVWRSWNARSLTWRWWVCSQAANQIHPRSCKRHRTWTQMPMNPVDIFCSLSYSSAPLIICTSLTAAVGLNVDNVTCMLVARCSNAHPLSLVSSCYRYFSFRLCIWYCIVLCSCNVDVWWHPVWSREHCRISPPRFLANCHKKRLNQASLVLLCFALRLVCVLSVFLICLLSSIF